MDSHISPASDRGVKDQNAPYLLHPISSSSCRGHRSFLTWRFVFGEFLGDEEHPITQVRYKKLQQQFCFWLQQIFLQLLQNGHIITNAFGNCKHIVEFAYCFFTKKVFSYCKIYIFFF